MSTTLAKALSTKQKTDGMSVEALAKAIGVSTVSVRGVLKGKSKPNKATASKYATFLGLSEADIIGESAKPAKKSAAKGAAKAGKKSGKKATKPAKAAKAKAVKAVKATKPGKAAKSADHPVFSRTLEEALNMFNDPLAVVVHGADDATRDLIARILGA